MYTKKGTLQRNWACRPDLTLVATYDYHNLLRAEINRREGQWPPQLSENQSIVYTFVSTHEWRVPQKGEWYLPTGDIANDKALVQYCSDKMDRAAYICKMILVIRTEIVTLDEL